MNEPSAVLYRGDIQTLSTHCAKVLPEGWTCRIEIEKKGELRGKPEGWVCDITAFITDRQGIEEKRAETISEWLCRNDLDVVEAVIEEGLLEKAYTETMVGSRDRVRNERNSAMLLLKMVARSLESGNAAPPIAAMIREYLEKV